MQTSSNAPQDGIQTLRNSLEKTLDQNRVLFSEIARFTQNESLRLAQLNIEHANHAFSRFDDHRNLSSLIGAQQEWIREMMQEYANQSLHYAEMFRSLAEGVRHQAEHAVSEFGADAAEVVAETGKKSKAVAQQAQKAAE
jgi:hypothetical protein